MGTLSVRYSEIYYRFGSRRVSLAGLVLMAVGLGRSPWLRPDANYVTPLHAADDGASRSGAGTCFPALVGLAIPARKMHQAGLASGLVNTTAQVGGALGLAVLATLSTTRTAHLAASGSSPSMCWPRYYLAFSIATARTDSCCARHRRCPLHVRRPLGPPRPLPRPARVGRAGHRLRPPPCSACRGIGRPATRKRTSRRIV